LAQWKVHFRSGPSDVFRALSTPAGRSRFWAVEAGEANGVIRFALPDGRTDDARVEEAVQDRLYRVRYFGSTWRFTLVPDESGGTDLTLSSDDPQDGTDQVSLLLRLKASVDFGVDLRNHDDGRTAGYVDS